MPFCPAGVPWGFLHTYASPEDGGKIEDGHEELYATLLTIFNIVLYGWCGRWIVLW